MLIHLETAIKPLLYPSKIVSVYQTSCFGHWYECITDTSADLTFIKSMYIQIISATLSSLSWWKMLMMNIVHDGDKNIGKMNQTENLVIHFWYGTSQCNYIVFTC